MIFFICVCFSDITVLNTFVIFFLPVLSAHANILMDSQHPEGMKKIKALEDRKADEPSAIPDKVSHHKEPLHHCIIYLWWTLAVDFSEWLMKK